MIFTTAATSECPYISCQKVGFGFVPSGLLWDEFPASTATCHLESTKQSTREKWETNYQVNVFVVMKLWQHILHWKQGQM